MAELDNIASELLKSANEADKNYAKTRDQSQKDKATRLRVIVQNLKTLTLGASDLNGLSDVTLTGVTNGQILLYDGATEQWINGSAGGGGDMLKSTYDVDNTGVVDNAEAISIIGRNATGATLYRGTIVYISGSTGNRPNFAKAQANAEATSAGTFGVVRDDIANNADGFVTTLGYLDNLDTRTVATHPFTDVTLADGDTVYLHPTVAGYITNVKPSAPNHIVYVGKVTRTSPTNGTIVYRIQNGYELDEIHDVAISSKANNDLLVYESATNLWKNKTFSAIFGGTPLVSIPTLDQVTTAGNTTTNAITVGGLTSTLANANVTHVGANAKGFYIRNNADSLVRAGLQFDGNTAYVELLGRYQNGAVFIRQDGANGNISFLRDGSEYLRIFGATGNTAIGTTTDAGYKLDVNGTARVATRIDAGTFTPGAGASAYTFATTGTITAAGGYNLRSPIFGDSGFSGLADNSGPTIYNNNATVARFNNIGGSLNGTNIDILQGYNPGAGTGNVVGVRHSYVLYPSADNTVSYTSFSATPYWNSAPFYNRITGPIRGFYFGNGLYNTQKLVDVIAFQSAGGRVLFEGELPSASAGISRGVYINQTHTAAANNDVLVGLDINPTFTNGAFTGLTGYGLRVKASLNTVNQTDYVASFENTHPLYGNGIQIIGAGDKGSARLLLRAGNNDGTDAFRVSGSGSIFVGTGNNANRGTVIDNNSISLGGYQTISNGNSIGIVFSPYSAANAVTFRQSGNVLIGTTTDSGYKLEVNGTTYSSNYVGNSLQIYGQAQIFSGNALQIFNSANNSKSSIQYINGSGLNIYNNSENLAGVLRLATISGNTVAAANNDVLVGLDINPTFTNGAFTGVQNYALRLTNSPAFFGGDPVAMFITNNASIRGNATTGGILYIDGSRDLTGTIRLRASAIDISGATSVGALTATAITVNGTNSVSLVTGTGVTSFRIGNTTSSSIWYFENNRNAPAGSLEITNSISSPGMTFFSSRNVAINSNTDAGYKLDVVGADSRFNGVRVGIGAGGVSTNTVVGLTALGNNTSGAGITAIGYQAAFNNTTGAITAIGHRAGYSNTTGINNTVLGGDAFYFNTTGSANVAVGFGSLQQNVTGSNNTAVGGGGVLYYNTASNNTAVGYQAAFSNTSGGVNTAIGYTALYSNTTGAANTALGYESLTTNSTGSNNTAIGRVSSKLNTTGSNNTSLGAFSLFANTTASDNVAIGNAASQNNVVGNNNTSVGSSALYSNTASNNTAVGYQAGFSNTSGGIVALGIQTLYSNTTGNENTAVGRVALYFNTTGNSNTSIGAIALYTNTTGSNNTANGQGALHKNTIGGNNTSVGSQSLFENTTGINNVAIGYNAGNGGVPNTTGSNNIFIGYQSTGVSATESNRTWIGNSSTTSTWLAGNVLIGTTTDAGYKLDVAGSARIQGVITGSVPAGGSLVLGASASNQRAIYVNGYFVSTGAIVTNNYNSRSYNTTIGGQENGLILEYNGNNQAVSNTNRYFVVAGNVDITGGTVDLHGYAFIPTIVNETNATIKAFSSTLSAASNRYNLYLSGTAQNYIEGSLGVGTTPSYKFHIASSAAANVFGTVQSTNASGTAAWVAFNDQSDNVVYRVFGSGASGTQLGVALSRSASLMANLGGSGKFLIGTYSGSDVAFGAGDQERMRIVNSTGNVLVGTTTDAGNKLEVSGTLNAVDFKVGGVPGWSGIITIPTMPPITITVNSGIITNVM